MSFTEEELSQIKEIVTECLDEKFPDRSSEFTGGSGSDVITPPQVSPPKKAWVDWVTPNMLILARRELREKYTDHTVAELQAMSPNEKYFAPNFLFK